MSLTRSLKRAAYRRSGAAWPGREQPTRLLQGGGYVTLRPTKGWLRVSGKRRTAQAKLTLMQDAMLRRRNAPPARV